MFSLGGTPFTSVVGKRPTPRWQAARCPDGAEQQSSRHLRGRAVRPGAQRD